METVKIADRELKVREATTGLYLRSRGFIGKIASGGEITLDDMTTMGIGLLWECLGDGPDFLPSSVNPGLTLEWVQNHTRFPLASEFFDVLAAAGLPVLAKGDKTAKEDAPMGEDSPQ